MAEKIIVMGGSFNPPTLAHQRLLLAAVDTFGADRGIFVPSSHTYVKIKMRRAKRPEETLPEDVRLAMLQAMAEDDPRLAVDNLEYHRTEKGYSYETMLSIQEKNPDSELYFLAGGDKLEVIPRWRRSRAFLERFRVIVVRRNGEDVEAALREDPFLREYSRMLCVMDAPPGLEGISSSAVRDLLRSGAPGAESMCHSKVWALLRAHGCMDGRAVLQFRDDYFFLSNFYAAPVRYDGVLYQNNEAAFQAQKCVTREERAAFADLPPDAAKKLGRRVRLRPDWEDVKVGIMEQIVRAKFTQNRELGRLLLATGSGRLEEGNTWNDTFWGTHLSNGKGENHLGIILIKIREELKKGQNAEYAMNSDYTLDEK